MGIALAERAVEILREKLASVQSDPASTQRGRVLIALAGPPGSGKTRLAHNVTRQIQNLPSPPKTCVVSLDGFHLTRSTLLILPNAEEALARRGALWTFDAEAAVELDPVPGGLVVPGDMQVCIIEGNYVLSDEGSWGAIAGLVDERWLLQVDRGLARTRVAARHLASGIEPTMGLALARTDYNDMPNGRFVMERGEGRYDRLIKSIEEPVSSLRSNPTPGSLELFLA